MAAATKPYRLPITFSTNPVNTISSKTGPTNDKMEEQKTPTVDEPYAKRPQNILVRRR